MLSRLTSFKRNHIFRYIQYRIFKPELRLSAEDKEPYLIHFQKKAAFVDYVATEFDEDINEQLNQYGAMEELEYLLEFNKKCFIEPRYGWVVSDGNVAFKRSLPYSITERTPLPHYIFYKRKKKKYLPAGIPLFYNWFNYWHFYNDIIGSLMVLDKLEVDKSVPIIVPASALEKQYVKDFFATPYAKKWNWLFVTHSDYVYLDKVYIAKSFANVKDQFLLAQKIFASDRKFGNRKIFLDRLPGGNGRILQNREEIIPVVEEFGFEVVTTEGMSVYDQKALFESASVILGIHGAGMTNMFFRYPEPCKILEIFPKGHYPIHYYWLAREFGFEYNAVAGDSNNRQSFRIEKHRLIDFLSSNIRS